MRTEIRLAPLAAVIGGIVVTLALAAPDWAWAQTAARSADEAIDVALGAIEAPVVQPLLVPPGRGQGIPPLPPYKQEPPAAQQDFRTLPSPAAPIPGPVGGSGKGVASPSGGGGQGSGSGSGAGVGGGKAPGAPGNPPVIQVPPPNIDPTPPDIGLPPPGPGLPLRPSRAR